MKLLCLNTRLYLASNGRWTDNIEEALDFSYQELMKEMEKYPELKDFKWVN